MYKVQIEPYMSPRITRQHAISHRPIENTGSNRNARKRGYYSTSSPVKKKYANYIIIKCQLLRSIRKPFLYIINQRKVNNFYTYALYVFHSFYDISFESVMFRFLQFLFTTSSMFKILKKNIKP